jgi:hypothetical protein
VEFPSGNCDVLCGSGCDCNTLCVLKTWVVSAITFLCLQHAPRNLEHRCYNANDDCDQLEVGLIVDMGCRLAPFYEEVLD